DRFRFFFQAEDGIRDFHVTGVQTCALPICTPSRWHRVIAGVTAEYSDTRSNSPSRATCSIRSSTVSRTRDSRRLAALPARKGMRSEERRGGEEWRAAWWAGKEEEE